MKLAIFAFVSSAFVASAAITGKLTVTYESSKVVIKGALTDLPKSVTGGGIHVHTGEDCTNGGKTTADDVNTYVGGHLFSNNIDGFAYPAKTTYSTDGAGKGDIDISAKYFVLTKDKTSDAMPHIEGRCIVMHGASTRDAIGKIVAKNGAYTAAMSKYPGPNDLATDPSGTLTVTVTAGVVKVKGSVTGLGKSLTNVGIHIHTGEDCTGGSDKTTKDKVNGVVGGHLLSKGDGFETTTYASDAQGAATVSIETPANAYMLKKTDKTVKAPAVENRCIVIHDKDKKRVGIGQIKCDADKCEAAMGAYPTPAAATAAAGSTATAAGSTTAAAGTTAAAKTGSATQMFTAFSALVVCAVLAF